MSPTTEKTLGIVIKLSEIWFLGITFLFVGAMFLHCRRERKKKS